MFLKTLTFNRNFIKELLPSFISFIYRLIIIIFPSLSISHDCLCILFIQYCLNQFHILWTFSYYFSFLVYTFFQKMPLSEPVLALPNFRFYGHYSIFFPSLPAYCFNIRNSFFYFTLSITFQNFCLYIQTFPQF